MLHLRNLICLFSDHGILVSLNPISLALFNPCGMSVIYDQIAAGGAWGWKILGYWKLTCCSVSVISKTLEGPSHCFNGWETLLRMRHRQQTEAETLILKAIDVLFFLTVLFIFHLCCKKGPINISADWKLPAAENRGQKETNPFFMWFSFTDTVVLRFCVVLH